MDEGVIGGARGGVFFMDDDYGRALKEPFPRRAPSRAPTNMPRFHLP
jgi:hypothetical protein